MKKEFVLSVCIMVVLGFLANGAVEASSFPTQVVLTGITVALFFYHVNRRNQGFTIDQVLAQKSLVVGMVAAVPVVSSVSSVL